MSTETTERPVVGELFHGLTVHAIHEDVPLQFVRRRYGRKTFTWMDYYHDGEWKSAGDPWPGIRWPQKEIRRELCLRGTIELPESPRASIKKYVFHADPSHGWLAVKRSELVRIGVLGQISAFSYQRGGTVYLEEDCDAPRFLNAKENHKEEYVIRHSHTNHRSPIRSYEPFTPEAA